MSERSEPPDVMTTDAERFARGLAKYREVYGDDAITFAAGDSGFFDLMITQLFGEVWTRPGLGIDQRRLLVMGVLAAQAKWDTLQIQLARALATGELTAEQVREVVIHLIPYVGYPSSSDLFRVSETAIALHAQPPSDDEGIE
jgi:4-carboxymuconolactone decarboxylase